MPGPFHFDFRSTRFASLYLFGLFFTGCQLIGPYQPPCTPTPSHWKTPHPESFIGPSLPNQWKSPLDSCSSSQMENAQSVNSSSPDQKKPNTPENNFEVCKSEFENWWDVFNDPILNQLEEQALLSSYTLQAALQRVLEARALAQVSRAALAPSINFAPAYSRSGMLIQNPIGAITGGIGAGQANQQGIAQQALTSSSSSASTTLPNAFRFVQSQYLLPFDFSYELDLWSKLTNTYDAALIHAQASAEAYYGVLLTLTADVASNYFQLRDLDAQQVVLEKTIQARKKALEINQARFRAGLIVYLDVSRAQVELARAESDSVNIKRLRGLQENMIATLIGTPASVFSLGFNPLVDPPPLIPSGLPSELLYRRPDIAEAERNLAAAYSDIAVAYTAFFPSVNLNAALGLESPFAHSLFSWKARLWEIGVNILQSVFDGGRNEANLDYYQAKFQETLANYQERVLTAFKDVEDSLVDIRERAVQAETLDVAVRASKETLFLAQVRYNQGLVNYLDVVDAERTLLETGQNSAIVLGERYLSTIRLIKALGGGWQSFPEPEACMPYATF